MIASQQKDNSTSVEPCKPAASLSTATDPRGEVYRCNDLDVIVRAPCGQVEGPAEIVWGPYHSPVSLSFKATRKSCPIQTYRKAAAAVAAK
jgi:hypothetical protein